MSRRVQAAIRETAGPSIKLRMKDNAQAVNIPFLSCIVDLAPLSAEFRDIRDASLDHIAIERDASLWSLPYRSSIHDISQEIHHHHKLPTAWRKC